MKGGAHRLLGPRPVVAQPLVEEMLVKLRERFVEVRQKVLTHQHGHKRAGIPQLVGQRIRVTILRSKLINLVGDDHLSAI